MGCTQSRVAIPARGASERVDKEAFYLTHPGLHNVPSERPQSELVVNVRSGKYNVHFKLVSLKF